MEKPGIQELRDQRREAKEAAEALVQNYTGDAWTRQIQGQFDGHLADVKRLDNEIDRYQRVLDATAIDALRDRSEGSFVDPVQAAEHKRAFNTFLRTGDESALRSFKNEMYTGSGKQGGYTIPTEMDASIDRLAALQSGIMEVAEVKSVSTPEYFKLVSLNKTEAGHVGETEDRAETDGPLLENMKPTWGTLYAYPRISLDVLDFSAYDIEGFLIEEVGDAFGRLQGDDVVNGDGVKKARGILTFPLSNQADSARPFGTIMYIPSGDASTILFDALKSMCWSPKRAYRKNASWLMNSATAAVCSKIKDDYGDYIWKQSTAEGQPSTLLGYKVVLDDFMPDPAAGNYPLLFGDFRRAFTIVQLGSALTLRDPYTKKGWVSFYFQRRVGTMLKNSEAIRAMKIGTN